MTRPFHFFSYVGVLDRKFIFQIICILDRWLLVDSYRSQQSHMEPHRVNGLYIDDNLPLHPIVLPYILFLHDQLLHVQFQELVLQELADT